ncbi:MAG: hypothetical protein V3V78_01480 [Candidatus Woesearchaeota archaeon]
MTIDQTVEIIRLPEEGIFKVVQLYLDNKPYLLCGRPDQEEMYHRDLLASFLLSKDIEYSKIPIPGDEALTMPSLGSEEERYIVTGMGVASISKSNKIFKLPQGDSHDYKISIDEEFNELLRNTLKDYTFS